MRWIKWIILTVLVALVAMVFHYTLPQRDIVRIIDAYEKRQDFGSNSIFWANPDAGTSKQPTRDVRFIDTVMPDGSVMVYRNEDTGFSWPFYFKFDSADLNAQAKELISTKEKPVWVAVRHYGWRFVYWTIFPNATSLKVVDGPDTRLIPWFNIIFFIVMGLCGLGIFRLLQRFKRRRIDPVLEDIEDVWDDASTSTRGFVGRMWDKISGAGK
jgi:uncharacterized protein DUF1523